MAEAVATGTNLVKRFKGMPAPALDGVSIAVEAGTITGLVGPDGAGKTTLIRMLAGLFAPDEGEVAIMGRPPGAMLEQLGYMPQRFGLYEDLTVRENLDLYAELRALPPEEREETFARLLAFTDLARFQDRLAGRLSGGMKQKLGLACTLVRTPKLMLLDEPGVGVDPISRRELWAMVQELTGEGIGILWSTAYLDEAEKCDSVYLLNDGRLLFQGPPGDLTRRVEGRVIQVTGFAPRRRHFLKQTLDRPDIADGTIQGRAVRLLVREGSPVPRANALDGGPGTRCAPAAARFEDGFIEILGGGPKGTSALAESYRVIPPSDVPAIEAHALTKRFGDFTAARDMDFSIPRGQIYGLLGPNGAGKSTTFKMLCGLLTPTSGHGAVAGNDLRHSAAEARASLGYMAQKFSLYGDLSVAQNLDFFAGAYDLDRAAARRAKEAMAEIFDLGDDEPTSGVDPVTRREFWTHINGLVEKGVTVLVTTHFMDEAEYCDNVSLIYRGEQIATGTPDTLKARAAELHRTDDPTMEDAFIALIEEDDRRREEEGQEAA